MSLPRMQAEDFLTGGAGKLTPFSILLELSAISTPTQVAGYIVYIGQTFTNLPVCAEPCASC